MKKVLIFSEEEFDKIRELLVDIQEDIWDLDTGFDRSIMLSDLEKLKELLGIF